ncbi:unnamed protein product [Ostreobium quekettii]|uniref:U3 small nucleolar RNA-associated protein 6 n=1 Tax=Ostreobium quekettii TaxID=121088 RepID=A0A8S1J4Q8_9CHLO|nr:unnamed protein product [Ostreobium quekettii]|eukprot:evm.model.scf_666.12 EVM.evm.TU.scf_666.12   scf_666:60457-67801(-)
MADSARYRLEELTPVVAALHKSGYFEKHELKVLVETMHDFECKIKSTTLKKEDWKRYIDHQLKVEQLRKIRQATRRIKKLGEDEGRLARKGIERHIHFLYSRAVHKFKGATELWEDWIDFCQSSRSYKRLSKVIHEALSYNPGCTSLRLKATEWELEHNENPTTARVLFQDGLRKVKGNAAKILWIHYFQMELQYVHKLKSRQEALGISLSGEGDDEGDEGSNAEETAVREVLGGALAKLVLRNALSAFPVDLSMRRALLSVLNRHTIESAEGLEEIICCELKEKLGKMPEAWDVVAQHYYAKALGQKPWTQALKEATLAFEEGLHHAPHVVDYYVDFLLQQLNGQEQGKGDPSMNSGCSKDDSQQEMLKLQLRNICKQACKEGSCSDSVVLCWLDLERELGTLEETAGACALACRLRPLVPQTWMRHLSVETQLSQGTNSRFVKLEQVCLDALRHLLESPAVWRACMDVMLECGVVFKPVQELMIQLAMRGVQSSEMGELMGEFVSIVGRMDGIDCARSFFRKITASALSLHASFYKGVIKMEEEEVVSNTDAKRRKRISSLYEAAVLKAGQEDIELWVDYARFEYRNGGNYGHLLWRAEKAGHSAVDLDRLWQKGIR